MKLSKRQLKRIIREEKQRLQEGQMPDSQTGTSLAENLHSSIIDILDQYLPPISKQLEQDLHLHLQDKMYELVATYTNGMELE